MKNRQRFYKNEIEKKPEGVISGYAVYWDKREMVDDGGMYLESHAPGSLKEDPTGVSLYCQHDKKRLLANTKSGTMRVWDDGVGLRYEAELPESASDIKELIERKDLQGVSVGYSINDEKYNGNKRDVMDGSVYDLSLTDKPALTTTLNMGSLNLNPRGYAWSELILGV